MDLPENLYDNLAYKITYIARQYRVLFDNEMEPLGLTRSQWWVLAHTYNYEGINQKELADILDINKSAVGTMIHKLEGKGWIIRKPSENDGRAYSVHLSPEMHHLMEGVHQLSDLLIDYSTRTLSKREFSVMNSGLDKLSEQLEKISTENLESATKLRKKLKREIDRF